MLKAAGSLSWFFLCFFLVKVKFPISRWRFSSSLVAQLMQYEKQPKLPSHVNLTTVPTFDNLFHFPVNGIYYGAIVGDLNGDGFNDMAFRSYSINTVYIVLGSATIPAVIDVETNDDALFYSASPYLGWELYPAGDVNKDGLDDFLASSNNIVRDIWKQQSQWRHQY